jgi:hypothetical protein
VKCLSFTNRDTFNYSQKRNVCFIYRSLPKKEPLLLTMSALEGLKPEGIWKYFDEVCQVPRPSKKEEKMTAYLKKFGESRNLNTIVEECGNVIISKQATKGLEHLPIVVIQSHIDMVCEKNSDVEHDFEKDPIQTYVSKEEDGDWIRAKGTTLGADGMDVFFCSLNTLLSIHPPAQEPLQPSGSGSLLWFCGGCVWLWFLTMSV